MHEQQQPQLPLCSPLTLQTPLLNMMGLRSYADLVLSSSLQEAATHFPETQDATNKVEDILAREMESVSLEERDKILFDIHGFSQQEAESENEINCLLEEMNKALNHQSIFLDREAYVQAKYLNPEYVTDRAFRLMFLRSAEHNPRLAAEKLISHFATKRELWGSGEILGRPVRQADLSDDDVEMLKSGVIQALPTHDVAGRTIFCFRFEPKMASKTFVSSDIARKNPSFEASFAQLAPTVFS